MGTEIYCDLCRANIPIPENMQKIMIGDSMIAEVDLTCAQQIKNSIQQQISEVAKQMEAAKAAVPALAAPAAAQGTGTLAEAKVNAKGPIRSPAGPAGPVGV